MGVERRASAEPAGGGLPRPEMPPTALGSAGGSLLRPPGAEKGGEEPVTCGANAGESCAPQRIETWEIMSLGHWALGNIRFA